MAVGVIATLTIKAGSNADFEARFLNYQQTVLDTEAGNIFFSLHRSRADPCSYTVMEQYRDEIAMEIHKNTAHYQAIPELFGALMAGPPRIEYLDAVE